MPLAIGAVLLCAIAVLIVLFTGDQFNSDKKELPTGVLVVGEHPFTQSTSNPFKEATLKEAEKSISKDVRFILLASNTKVSSATLAKWVDEQKVVLFYGEDVQPEEVEKKFDLDFNLENILIESNLDIPYVLFGYGYSKKAEAPVVFFHKTNDKLQRSIFDFIDSTK